MRLSLDPLIRTQRLTAHHAQIVTHRRRMAAAGRRQRRNHARRWPGGAGWRTTSVPANGCTTTGVSNDPSAEAGMKQNSGTYEPEGRLIRNFEWAPVLPYH